MNWHTITATSTIGTFQDMLAWNCWCWIEYMIQNFNAHMLTLEMLKILDRSGHSASQWWSNPHTLTEVSPHMYVSLPWCVLSFMRSEQFEHSSGLKSTGVGSAVGPFASQVELSRNRRCVHLSCFGFSHDAAWFNTGSTWSCNDPTPPNKPKTATRWRPSSSLACSNGASAGASSSRRCAMARRQRGAWSRVTTPMKAIPPFQSACHLDHLDS